MSTDKLKNKDMKNLETKCCKECPFISEGYCNIDEKMRYTHEWDEDDTVAPTWCPLLKESITVSHKVAKDKTKGKFNDLKVGDKIFIEDVLKGTAFSTAGVIQKVVAVTTQFDEMTAALYSVIWVRLPAIHKFDSRTGYSLAFGKNYCIKYKLESGGLEDIAASLPFPKGNIILEAIVAELNKPKSFKSAVFEYKEHSREELRDRYKEDRRKEPIERVDLMQTLYVRWLEDQLIKE